MKPEKFKKGDIVVAKVKTARLMLLNGEEISTTVSQDPLTVTKYASDFRTRIMFPEFKFFETEETDLCHQEDMYEKIITKEEFNKELESIPKTISKPELQSI